MISAPRAPSIVAMILTHFWFKMFGTMAFTFLFFAGSVYLLKNPAAQTATIPSLWLDRVVTFQPAALPLYLSLWLYVSLPPMLMLTRRDIATYGIRISLLCLFAFAIFYGWPNAVPPANIDWAAYPGVAFLKGVDAAGNACPSLHVATAVFSAIWLFWRLNNLGFSWSIQAANIVWCIAIAYSTLATKQHVAIDVLAGTALGIAAAWLTGLKQHADNASLGLSTKFLSAEPLSAKKL